MNYIKMQDPAFPDEWLIRLEDGRVYGCAKLSFKDISSINLANNYSEKDFVDEPGLWDIVQSLDTKLGKFLYE